MIKEIYIRNFRSIREMRIDCEEINTFIGKNDAGKSNVMKALNLFFNDTTDTGMEFDFNTDFCTFDDTPEKSAPEIVIEVVVEVPRSYGGYEGSQLVVWRKVWRRSGIHEHGGYIKHRAETKKIGNYKYQDMIRRSRIPSFLEKNIDFLYIPAIKDKFYFSSLLGELYKALAGYSLTAIKESTNDFEKAIGNQTQELITKLNNAFGKKSAIKLPTNFRKIFEDLDFSLDGIPLSQRGDGIKIRHIPEILSFIAELTKKTNKINIWAFEEPENCLEIKARRVLSKSLARYVKQERYQIFLTTHSPIFYTIEQQEINNKNYYVYQGVGKNETNENDSVHEEETRIELIPESFKIEERMEDLSLEEAEEKIKEKNMIKELKSYNQELETEITRLNENFSIFFEGKTDSIIMRRVLDLKYPVQSKNIILLPNPDSSQSIGANNVRTLLRLWKEMHANNQKAKAYVIFDDDNEGRNSYDNTIDEKNDNIMICKLNNQTLRDNIEKMTVVPEKIDISLEAMYSDTFWGKAQENNWVKMRSYKKRFSNMPDSLCFAFTMFCNDINNSGEKHDCENYYFFRNNAFKWADKGKKAAANHIKNCPDDEAREILKEFDTIADDIIKFFFG